MAIVKSLVDVQRGGSSAFAPRSSDVNLTVNVPADVATIQEGLDFFNNTVFTNGSFGTVLVAAGTHVVDSLQYRNNTGTKILLRGIGVATAPTAVSYTGVKTADEAVFRSRYPTIVEFTGGGIINQQPSTNLQISNLGCINTPIGAGFRTGLLTYIGSNFFELVRVGFFGFAHNMYMTGNASVTAYNCEFIHGSVSGVYSFSAGTVFVTASLCAYNTTYGIYNDVGTKCQVKTTEIIGGQIALQATRGAFVRAVSCTMSGQTAATLASFTGSAIHTTSSTLAPTSGRFMLSSDNSVIYHASNILTGGFNIRSANQSSTHGSGITGAPTYTPALNTIGADNSLNT